MSSGFNYDILWCVLSAEKIDLRQHLSLMPTIEVVVDIDMSVISTQISTNVQQTKEVVSLQMSQLVATMSEVSRVNAHQDTV